MKKFKLILAFFFIQAIAFSQGPADKWFFGVNAGVDFSSGIPAALTYGAINTPEGCAAICDNAGGLLFYTDGITVWNKNSQVMPNGTGLTGGSSSTQAALIVPQTGSLNLYYIFTTDEIGGGNGCRYSIVDMNLQGGMGDITASKNILVLNNVTEKLTAVQELTGSNYKIAIHEWGSDAFYVYTLTSSGFQITPVISNVGIVHTTSQIQNTYGQMKFSPCGDKIALAAGYLNTVEIFDFDDLTGVVSNAITLPMPDHVYGLEFSPDGRFLYVSTYDVAGTLLQFDLSSGNAVTILASKAVLSVTPDTYAIQLAPDGKIYTCKSFSYYLGVINDPSISGTGCNYTENGLLLDPNFLITSALGLPAFVQSFFRSENLCPLLGIEPINAGDETFIFPNLATSTININLDKKENIIIFNLLGETIMEKNFNAQGKFELDISSLPSGIYFIKAGSQVGKFVKE
ncbi:MAG: T9SS type A sorting domain-containing protein [Bacteroidia bacterium]